MQTTERVTNLGGRFVCGKKQGSIPCAEASHAHVNISFDKSSGKQIWGQDDDTHLL